MRLATWNLARPIRRELTRRARIQCWLTEIDADIWVLTETHADVSPGPAFAGVAEWQPARS